MILGVIMFFDGPLIALGNVSISLPFNDLNLESREG